MPWEVSRGVGEATGRRHPGDKFAISCAERPKSSRCVSDGSSRTKLCETSRSTTKPSTGRVNLRVVRESTSNVSRARGFKNVGLITFRFIAVEGFDKIARRIDSAFLAWIIRRRGILKTAIKLVCLSFPPIAFLCLTPVF
jgi:hypothetical protein